MQTGKVQARLHSCAVSPEPSLFADVGVKEPSYREIEVSEPVHLDV